VNPLVSQCVALRERTLALLSGAVEPEAWVHSVANTPTNAWWLFLAAEACATPIRVRLGKEAHLLPVGVKGVLDHACREELQRILTVRMQLAIIDRAAGATGLAPVVLKGGVAVAEGVSGFDLGDVDLLLPATDCERLAQALREIGGVGQLSVQLPGALPTDIHATLDVGSGLSPVIPRPETQPISEYAHLRRLRNVPHAAYIIQHCTTQHPSRRGNLRDLMLLAETIRTFSTDELEELSAALQTSPERALYEGFLMRARAINTGTALACDPSVALMAAAHYALSLRWPNTVGPVRQSLRGMSTYFFGSRSDVGRALRIYLLKPVEPGSFWMPRALSTRVPRLARLTSYVLRTPYRAALLLYSASVAMAFRLDYERQ
jgi:hypothetical protein